MKIKSMRLVVAMTIAGVVGPLSTMAAPVFAEPIEADACNNLEPGTIAYESNGCGDGGSDQLPTVIQNILDSVILVSGIVAVVFVVIGGVQYMTSAGDPGKVKKARDTILYACIGLVICVLAFVIVNWTIDIIGGAK